MKANDNPKLPTVNKSKSIVKNAQNSHEVNSKKVWCRRNTIRILNPILFQLFSPGCGHNECAHCDNDQNTSEASSPPPPPPLPHHSSHPLHPPPLPPKPPWMRSSITRPRPLSYNETSSETTETSEHETVIYSKNVKLNNGKNSISEVNKIKKIICIEIFWFCSPGLKVWVNVYKLLFRLIWAVKKQVLKAAVGLSVNKRM